MVKRPLGDITNLKRNNTSLSRHEPVANLGSYFPSIKATDLIRRSLIEEPPTPWKTNIPEKTHVHTQTDMNIVAFKDEPTRETSQDIYDWETETIEELKHALKDALNENKVVSLKTLFLWNIFHS
jgi:hypothetical protein